MVFSTNVFKNKKRWQNKKTLKNVKNVPWIKNVKTFLHLWYILGITKTVFIWFVNHWWHLTSSTLFCVWPCCTPGPWSTSRWCSASDDGYLRRQKGNGQLEDRRMATSQRLAQQGLGGCQRSYCCLRSGEMRSPGVTSRSGATVTLTTRHSFIHSLKLKVY